MAKKNPNVVIKQDEDNPISKEVLAESIKTISDGMNKLLASGLNRDAVEILVRHSSGVNREDVKRVLNALRDLAANYTTGRR